MTSKLDWNSVGGNKKNGTGSGKKLKNLEFIKFVDGASYNIRPLGNPIVFLKAGVTVNGAYRSAIIEDPDSPVVKKFSNMNVNERYAVNVLDRSDKKIKIMEGPLSIFGEFKSYSEHTQKNPGLSEGADFNIKASGEGKNRRYATKFAKNTVLSDAEKAMIKEQGLYDLEKVFKVVPDDELEDKLFNSSGNKQQQYKKSNDTVAEELGLDGTSEAADATSSDDLDLNF
jgi:hypothetical protein